MKKFLVVLLGMVLWGKTTSLSERTDDWWVKPHVDVTVEYRPYYVPKYMVAMDECRKQDYYLAPWITEVEAEISAYNSQESQTDSDPWTAANNRRVFEGGIATNVLPCGSQIMIPELFGNMVFTVNDRMNRRYHPLNPLRETDGKLNFDVWMLEEYRAWQLGRKGGKKVVIVAYAGA